MYCKLQTVKTFFFGQKDLDCQIYTSQIDLITFMMDSRSLKGNIMVQGNPLVPVRTRPLKTSDQNTVVVVRSKEVNSSNFT